MKKFLVWFIVILVIAGIVFGVMKFTKGKEQIGYKTVKVEKGDVISMVTATGTLNAVTLVTVGSQITGKIVKIYVDYNSMVHKGQVLAEIEQDIYKSKVDEARSGVISAKGNLDSAQAAIQNALAGVRSAEANMLTVQAELRATEANISDAQAVINNNAALIREAKNNVEVALISIRNAQAQARNAKANIESAKAAINKGNVAVTDAKRTLARMQTLLDKQLISQSDKDNAQTTYDTALANLQSNKAQYNSSIAQYQASLTQIESAKEQHRSAQSRYQSVLAQKESVLAKYRFAQANYQVSQAKYKASAAQYQAALAQHTSAVGQYENSLGKLKQAQSALAQANTNLTYTVITAPVNGTVVARKVDVGQTVTSGLQTPTLFTIAEDLTKMKIDTNIDEADIAKIKIGQDVNFTVDAFPNMEFKGKVEQVRIEPIVEQNVVTYNTVVSVSNPQLKLKPGMTANVSLIVAHKKSVSRLPNAALRYSPSHLKPAERKEILESLRKANENATQKTAVVWLLGEDGKPKLLNIKIGSTDEDYTEVISDNLQRGQRVITEEQKLKGKQGLDQRTMQRAVRGH